MSTRKSTHACVNSKTFVGHQCVTSPMNRALPISIGAVTSARMVISAHMMKSVINLRNSRRQHEQQEKTK